MAAKTRKKVPVEDSEYLPTPPPAAENPLSRRNLRAAKSSVTNLTNQSTLTQIDFATPAGNREIIILDDDDPEIVEESSRIPSSRFKERSVARHTAPSSGRRRSSKAANQSTLTQMPCINSDVYHDKGRPAKRRRVAGHASSKPVLLKPSSSLKQSTLTQIDFVRSFSRSEAEQDEDDDENMEDIRPYQSEGDEEQIPETVESSFGRPATPTDLRVEQIATRPPARNPTTPNHIRVLEVPSSNTPPDWPLSNQKERNAAHQSPLSGKSRVTPLPKKSAIPKNKILTCSSPVQDHLELDSLDAKKHSAINCPSPSPEQQELPSIEDMQFQTQMDSQTQISPMTKRRLDDFNRAYNAAALPRSPYSARPTGDWYQTGVVHSSSGTTESEAAGNRAPEMDYSTFPLGDETQAAFAKVQTQPAMDEVQAVGGAEVVALARPPELPLQVSFEVPVGEGTVAGIQYEESQSKIFGEMRRSRTIPDSQDEEEDGDVEEDSDVEIELSGRSPLAVIQSRVPKDKLDESTSDLRTLEPSLHAEVQQHADIMQSKNQDNHLGSSSSNDSRTLDNDEADVSTRSLDPQPSSLPSSTPMPIPPTSIPRRQNPDSAQHSSPTRPSQATTVPCTPSAQQPVTQINSSAWTWKSSQVAIPLSPATRPEPHPHFPVSSSAPNLGAGDGSPTVPRGLDGTWQGDGALEVQPMKAAASSQSTVTTAGGDGLTVSQLLPNSLMSDVPLPPRWSESMEDDDLFLVEPW